jgi:hypothetical protein
VIGRPSEDPQYVKPVFRLKDFIAVVRSVGHDGRMRREQTHEQRRASAAEARDDQGPQSRLE